MNAMGDLLQTESIDYQKLLIEEIVRVVGDQGVVFGGPSGKFMDRLLEKGYKKEVLVGFFIYYK